MDAYHVFSQHLSWRSSCCKMWSGCPGQKPFSFSPGSPAWWKGGGIEEEVGRLSERCRFPTSGLTPALHEAEFVTSGHLLRAFKPAPGNAGERGHIPFLQSCAVLPSQGTFQKWKANSQKLLPEQQTGLVVHSPVMGVIQVQTISAPNLGLTPSKPHEHLIFHFSLAVIYAAFPSLWGAYSWSTAGACCLFPGLSCLSSYMGLWESYDPVYVMASVTIF